MSDFIVGVPYNGCPNGLVATREDEAIAIAVGAWLAGKEPQVYMQDSGLGNSLDVICSLLLPYKIDIEILINRRLEPEHHKIMGERSKEILKLIGYDTIRYC